jgi:hypothetical protein
LIVADEPLRRSLRAGRWRDPAAASSRRRGRGGSDARRTVLLLADRVVEPPASLERSRPPDQSTAAGEVLFRQPPGPGLRSGLRPYRHRSRAV